MNQCHDCHVQFSTESSTNIDDKQCLVISEGESVIYDDLESFYVTKDWLKNHPTFRCLAKDLYHALSQGQPVLKVEEACRGATKGNHRFLRLFLRTPAFEGIRQPCMFNSINSSIATDLIMIQLKNIIKSSKKAQQWEQYNDHCTMLEDGQTTLGEQVASLSHLFQKRQEAGRSTEDVERQLQKANQTVLELDRHGQDFDTRYHQQIMISETLPNISKQLNETLSRVGESLKEANTFSDEWGFNEGCHRRIPFDEKKTLMTRLQSSKKLKDISKRLGRMEEQFQKGGTLSSATQAHTVKNIKRGNDLGSLLPSEKVMLKHPLLKKDFYQRFMSKNLLEYDKTAKKPKGRGPIICCLDVSGSMDGPREEWGKAMAVTLAKQAAKQKRSFLGILFDHQVQLKVFFPKGRLNLSELLDFAESFSGGGTVFEAPLKEALSLIKTEGLEHADICFITDGNAELTPTFIKHFNQVKQRLNFKCVGITLNPGSRNTLDAFCDEVTQLNDSNL